MRQQPGEHQRIVERVMGVSRAQVVLEREVGELRALVAQRPAEWKRVIEDEVFHAPEGRAQAAQDGHIVLQAVVGDEEVVGDELAEPGPDLLE